MQQGRRTNQQRSDETRAALLAAARRLFVERGYAGTSTPDIVAEVGVSRGALYHQFADKQALFQAVLVEESRAITDAIDSASSEHADARSRLISGTQGYLLAMRVPGRCRLLLVEGPTALGPAQMRSIDLDNGARTLVAGLREAAPHARAEALAAFADLLSAAFDKAALLIDQGAESHQYEQAAVDLLLAVADRLAQGEPRQRT